MIGLSLLVRVAYTGNGVPRTIGSGRRWTRWAVGSLVVAALAAGTGISVHRAVRDLRKSECVNNLKSIGRASYRYQEEHGHFPAATITDSRGKPLLSWRVALLPYLGERDLYAQFRLDEPWDSPHNRALVARMPAVYACPSEPRRARGMTRYQAVVGPNAGLGVVGTMFEARRGVDIREATDGTSNTILVAEAATLVPWTRPDDLRYAQDAPLPSFGSRHRGGFHVAFVDGSVRLLKFTLAPETLRTLLTRDGGEVLSA
jgi:prepilin-type processing-associated H-X9-DG protein